MFTSFIMRKMLDAQLKNMPAEQKEKILQAFDKNPELFKKIAIEIEQGVKSGVDQMTAAKQVAEKYKQELGTLLTGENGNQ